MSRKEIRSSLLITLALILICIEAPLLAAPAEEAVSVSTQSQDEQAATLLSTARTLRTEGKHAEALVRLESALELTGSPALLWPIAELCLSIGLRERGLEALTEYRRQVPLARSDAADALEQKLRALPAEEAPSPSPLPPPPPNPPPGPEPPRRAPILRPISVAAIAVAAGLVVVAAGVGGRALYGQRSLDALCQPTEAGSLCLVMGNQQVDELRDRAAQAQSWSTAGWSLTGIAAGSVILSVVTVALDLRKHRERTRVVLPISDSQSRLSFVR